MFNSSKSLISEKNTFVDDFESGYSTVTDNAPAQVDREEENFNSRISANMDRILHYDNFSRSDMQKVAPQNTADLTPGATPMQFKDVAKEDINKDLRMDASYKSETKINAKSKTALVLCALVTVVLAVLIVLNTVLLNNMNRIIDDKLQTVEELETKKRGAENQLNDVKNEYDSLTPASGN